MNTYFMMATNGHLKIGISRQPLKRLRDINSMAAGLTVELLGMIEGNREKQIHRILKSERLNGEWFRLSRKSYRLMSRILLLSDETVARLSSLMGVRLNASTQRGSRQKGHLIIRGKNPKYICRWREKVLAEGRIVTRYRSETIGLVSNTDRRHAEEMLANLVSGKLKSANEMPDWNETP